MDDITRSNWRNHLKVHPAAELFPLLSETDPAALKELAEDIKQHGQREPASYIKNSDGDRVLLDGRNRLDALEMLGRKIDINDSRMFEQLSSSIDAQAFIISKNIYRRHLSAEDKRDLIGLLLKANPEKSDRQIGKQIGAHHSTVSTVRKEKEATGEISQLNKTVGADGKARTRPTVEMARQAATGRDKAEVTRIERAGAKKKQEKEQHELMAAEIGRFADKLIHLDIEIARELSRILWDGGSHRLMCALDDGIQIVEFAESRLEVIQSLGLKDLTVAPEHTNLKAGEAAPDSNADGLDLSDNLKRAAP
jgi:ParB-like chromosome segregation protein Spo0J